MVRRRQAQVVQVLAERQPGRLLEMDVERAPAHPGDPQGLLDRDRADVFAAGLLLCDTIRKMYPEAFRFIQWEGDPCYSIDKLLGTDVYRTGRMTAEELILTSREKVDRFTAETKKYHLY